MDGVFALLADLRIERGEIELHLADELRLEFADLEFHGHEAFQPAMEQQQVNEVFLVVHLQPELAADKGEQPAHRAQEIFDAGNERPLQLALGVFLAQFQEIEECTRP